MELDQLAATGTGRERGMIARRRSVGGKVEDYERSSLACELVWFDPGGTTGWAVFAVHPAALWRSDLRVLDNVTYFEAGDFAGPELEVAYQMVGLTRAWPGAAIGSEDFILRRYSQDRALLSPVRQNARLEWELWKQKRELLLQDSSIKRVMTEQRMHRLWDVPGGLSEHGRDAIRHCLHFLMRCKGSDKKSAALRASSWPTQAKEYA